MAFEFESEQTNRIPSLVMNTLHFFAVMAGVLAVWFTCDGIVKFFMSKRKFVMITSFSFIIFGLHVPLLNYVMQLAYMFGHNIPYYRLLFYILVPFLVWVFCIAFGAVLRRILPSVYSIVTGGRGI